MKKFTALVSGVFLAVCAFYGAAVYALENSAEWPITDFNNSSVDFSEILSGGPPKDGIPSIDEPKFIDIDSASEWLQKDEPVIVVSGGTSSKAYPLQILTWHEIVNDKIDNTSIAVTFCPLCNASIVFDRTINGVEHDFGTTGRLRRSDMVMYDRQTESWWQQFTGTGIIGKMNEVRLDQIPSHIVSFESFKEHHPDGMVLSRDTGINRDYGRNPYPGYDNINSSPFLFRGKTDDRLPPMERVLTLSSENSTLLFDLPTLKKQPVLNTKFEGNPVAVFSFTSMNSALDKSRINQSRLIPSAAIYDATVDGKILTFELQDDRAVDKETGSRWTIFGVAESGPLSGKKLTQLDGGVHFAFAWFAFDPEAEIFKP